MSTLDTFSLNAAKRYLQNIVFVDDEIYDRNSDRPVEQVRLDLPSYKHPFSSGSQKSVDESDAAQASQPPFHPRHLVESFAKEGMVCALYEPAEGFDTGKESGVFKLCERADALILDWDLFNEDGNNILPLIRNLVDESQSSIPHHVRLCVIYTTKPDLSRVADAIYNHLKQHSLDVQDVQQPLTLIAGATRIIVRGKPNVSGRPQESKDLEISENDLADSVIHEFAKMNKGILPSYALHGMASIRHNSKKVLDKFHDGMDGPFLLHRALLISEEEAFDQLPELVAEELLSVIADEQISADQIGGIVASAVGALDLDIKDLKWSVPDKTPQPNSEETARKFLIGGTASIAADKASLPKKNGVQALHTAMGCNSSQSEKRLATLFNVRSRYKKSKLPSLGFGTIVRFIENENLVYGFCLMPLCDSMHLKSGQRVAFPFWKLKGVDSNVRGHGVVVLTHENEYVHLVATGKPRNMLWMDNFQPSDAGIVASTFEDTRYWFSGGNNRLEWVAQLKPAHAQRIANFIGQTFSRVGLVEAEWLRLLSPAD